MVSVPSRGILFPNADKELDEKIAKGFRPLSGYLISKYCRRKIFQTDNRKSFRPLSGYLISKS